MNTHIEKHTRQLFSDIVEVVTRLNDEEYVYVCSPSFESSIGAHVRHVLDHYLLFLNNVDKGFVDYDLRPLAPESEKSKTVALDLFSSLLENLNRLPDPGVSVTVSLSLSVSDPAERQSSTVGRELVFLHHHATHHYSMIAAIMRELKRPVPTDMGVAASTLKRRERLG